MKVEPIMFKPIIITIALLVVTGCAVSTEPASVADEPATLGYVACTTVTDTVPNDDCGSGQTVIERCSAATENPDEMTCTGPLGKEVQKTGRVWCCLPSDAAVSK